MDKNKYEKETVNDMIRRIASTTELNKLGSEMNKSFDKQMIHHMDKALNGKQPTEYRFKK